MSDELVEKAANALRGFTVMDDECCGWSMDKSEREEAARLVLAATNPALTQQVKTLTAERDALHGRILDRLRDDPTSYAEAFNNGLRAAADIVSTALKETSRALSGD